MNKTDYWFLDSVVYTTYPVYWLGAPDDNLGMLINHEPHRLPHPVVAQTLYKLTQQGDLAVYLSTDEDDTPGWRMQPILLSVADLEAALHTNRHYAYALTQQGGERWEAASRPDWQRYISIAGTWGGKRDTREIIALTRQLVEEYIALHPDHQPEERMISESMRWDVVQPWQALYWKRLPEAHRVQFEVVSQPMPQDPAWHNERYDMLQQWYKKTRWYTDPFRV